MDVALSARPVGDPLMALELHRKLARKLGYDIQKFNKQVVVETHLRYLLPLRGIECVIDVGANVGQYAKGLREVIGYTGEIHSFEPLPAAFDVLAKEASADPLWHAYNYALGDEDGEAELNVMEHTVFSSLHDANAQGHAKFKDGIDVAETVKVPLRRLDGLVAELGIDVTSKPTLLKMDTQGHDAWVFKGASGIMEHIEALQSEVSVVGIYDGVPTYIELFATYTAAGFELTGVYTLNRYRDTGHIIELDCVFAKR